MQWLNNLRRPSASHNRLASNPLPTSGQDLAPAAAHPRAHSAPEAGYYDLLDLGALYGNAVPAQPALPAPVAPASAAAAQTAATVVRTPSSASSFAGASLFSVEAAQILEATPASRQVPTLVRRGVVADASAVYTDSQAANPAGRSATPLPDFARLGVCMFEDAIPREQAVFWRAADAQPAAGDGDDAASLASTTSSFACRDDAASLASTTSSFACRGDASFGSQRASATLSLRSEDWLLPQRGFAADLRYSSDAAGLPVRAVFTNMVPNAPGLRLVDAAAPHAPYSNLIPLPIIDGHALDDNASDASSNYRASLRYHSDRLLARQGGQIQSRWSTSASGHSYDASISSWTGSSQLSRNASWSSNLLAPAATATPVLPTLTEEGGD